MLNIKINCEVSFWVLKCDAVYSNEVYKSIKFDGLYGSIFWCIRNNYLTGGNVTGGNIMNKTLGTAPLQLKVTPEVGFSYKIWWNHTLLLCNHCPPA